MPQEMLRTYALEAMWTGGTLVFKGIPPGKDFKTFITEDLQSLVYGKGAFASISIDPRLYESYGIKAVPTIVLTEDRANPRCLSAARSFTYGTETLRYQTCPKLAEDRYWKIAGTVTSNYALLEFKAHGAKSADAHLAALAKGLSLGISSSKTALPYTGAWVDAISPADVASGREAVAKMRQKQQQPLPSPLAPQKINRK
jgi:type-F conjugative transfer system pilin assembly protein TrbC